MNNTVGILTYHRSHNYGAILQALALHKVISDLGYKVNIVDYWPEYHKDMYRIIPSTLLNGKSPVEKLRRYVSTALRYPRLVKRRNKFLSFIDRYVAPICSSSDQPYHTLVFGSDQIWRKQPALGNRFNPIYFGAGPVKTDKLVSYAASMGRLTDSVEDRCLLKEWLSKFSGISVREADLKLLLEEIGFSDVIQVLDPTLLLSAHEWKELLPIVPKETEKPYILFYDLMPDSFDISAIKQYAASRGCDLLIIPGNLDKFRYSRQHLTSTGPLEFLSYVSNAEAVFTSSYHGLAFSLIFHKEVFASFAHNASRAESLLQSIGASDHLLSPMIKEIPNLSPIDYDKADGNLQKLRQKSLDFLRANLSES